MCTVSAKPEDEMHKLKRWIKRNWIGILGTLAIAGMLSFDGAIKPGAQGFVGIFQSGLSNAPSAYGAGDSTSGLYFGTGFTGFTKHVAVGTGGAATTVATCGTGTIAGNDVAGKVTATGATACTVTFGAAYTTAPYCSVTDGTTAAGLKVVTTTTTAAVTGLTSGDVFYYVCLAPSGG
jgi:hypothetical protein